MDKITITCVDRSRCMNCNRQSECAYYRKEDYKKEKNRFYTIRQNEN